MNMVSTFKSKEIQFKSITKYTSFCNLAFKNDNLIPTIVKYAHNKVDARAVLCALVSHVWAAGIGS